MDQPSAATGQAAQPTAAALTVGVAGQRIALPAGAVAEIVRPRPLTRVPHAPESLLGLANLRGAALPVIALSRLLGVEAAGGVGARIVVIDPGGDPGGSGRIGLLVDAVVALGPAEAPPLDLDGLLARAFAGLLRRDAACRNAAAAAPAASVPGARGRALIGLRLAGQEYALPLAEVSEIAALPSDVTHLPGSDAAMLGVVHRRGATLPLVSLRALLGLPPADDLRRARVVVTMVAQRLVGLVVDGTSAVLRVPEAAIEKVPPVLTRGQSEARIEAICRLDGGRRLVLLLSPAGLFDDATAFRLLAGAVAAAAPAAASGPQEAAEPFLVFRLGEEEYGLPVAAVDEVVRRPAMLARVPHAPDFLDGMMNLRGKAIPVIDQGRRLAAPGDGAAAPLIIVVTVDGRQAGFAVSGGLNVLRAKPSELGPVPVVSTRDAPIFDRIAGLERDGRMILLIDPATLMSDAARDLLAALAGGRPDDRRA